MTNSEKFVTANARVQNYFAQAQTIGDIPTIQGFASWLEIECEEEKPLPCPFCGGEMDVSASKCAIHCVCGYSSPIDRNISKVIAAHNRVAKNCQEAK